MKIKFSLIVAMLFVFQIALAQENPFFETYDWEETPNYKIEKTSKEDMIAVKEKTVTEFYFDKKDLVEYYLEHKVLWLNSDDAIEENNKIYLPFSSEAKLQVNKARVITSEGKLID